MDLITLCEILGTVTGLSGSVCQTQRATRTKFCGFVLFVVSDIFLTVMGLHDSRFWFTFLQVAFAVISTYGAWVHRPSTWKSNG